MSQPVAPCPSCPEGWRPLDKEHCPDCYEGRIERLKARIEALEAALERIVQWSEAYPLDIFPEPDWKRAAELLKAGGVTMDAVSAHCMRHVVEGVGEIARAALDKDAGK